MGSDDGMSESLVFATGLFEGDRRRLGREFSEECARRFTGVCRSVETCFRILSGTLLIR